MLKKIFLCLFAGVFFVAGANAAAVDPLKCVAYGITVTGQTSGSERPAINADYVIYFDNNSSDIPNDCKAEVKGIVEKLAKEQGDIETVLLFGSADGVGNSNYNAKLAQKRVNTVANRLKGEGFTDEQLCEYSNDGNVSGRCARTTMGDAFSRERGYLKSSEADRAVFMFVIYKNAQCTEAVIDTLNTLQQKVRDDDVQTKLTTAQSYCNKDNQEEILLQSQYNAIMDAINSAIQKYPELSQYVPSDLSVSVLVSAIEAVRRDLSRDASVWKTADGGFNYARLASDSVAGVVLGTAGGIITSKLVKKSQLSKGFEDIMCTIGGQNVAGWDDEFSVGVR